MSIRSTVFARDLGICAECGVDAERRQRVLRLAWLCLWRYALVEFDRYDRYEVVRLGYHFSGMFGRDLWRHSWEADHIVEIRDGGSNDLGNLQTLCLDCHKRKTRNYGREVSNYI